MARKKSTVRRTFELDRALLESIETDLEQRGSTLDAWLRLELIAYVSSRRPALGLEDMIWFGRYRGAKMEELIRTRPDYIEWCLRKVDGFQLKTESERLLQDVLAGDEGIPAEGFQ